MSLFAFLGGRHDTRAWARALTAAGCKLPKKPSHKILASMTDQTIADDCRIIRECARDIMQTESSEERRQKHLVLYSRYARLTNLSAYAASNQKKIIEESRKLVTQARKYK